jgi:hypothetical protein
MQESSIVAVHGGRRIVMGSRRNAGKDDAPALDLIDAHVEQHHHSGRRQLA